MTVFPAWIPRSMMPCEIECLTTADEMSIQARADVLKRHDDRPANIGVHTILMEPHLHFHGAGWSSRPSTPLRTSTSGTARRWSVTQAHMGFPTSALARSAQPRPVVLLVIDHALSQPCPFLIQKSRHAPIVHPSPLASLTATSYSTSWTPHSQQP